MRGVLRGNHATSSGAKALLSGNKVSLEAVCRPLTADVKIPPPTVPSLRQTIPSISQNRSNFSTKASAASYSNIPQQELQSLSEADQTLRQRLDFKPCLSVLDVIVTVLIPAGICGLLYYGIRPKNFSPLYALGMGMIYAAWVAITRAVLLERQYSKRLVAGEHLGDPDSKFPLIEGLKVHAKIFRPPDKAVKALIHCFHGFGANVESWTSVQERIAREAQVQISAHDKPGFGLTERPMDPKKYSSEFNAKLGRTILDSEANALQNGQHASLEEGKGGKTKRVLIGHSMGSGSAASEAIRDPEGVDGLILVAPAIMVFGFIVPQHSGKSGSFQSIGNSSVVNFDQGEAPPPLLERPQKNVFKRMIVGVSRAILSKFSNFTKLILAPFTIVSLRAAVRSRKFWEKGLARAWFDKRKLTPQIIDAYRKPQLVKGWERGLVNFTSSRMSGNVSIRQVVKDAWNGRVKPLQAEQMAEIVANHNIKVLIVHGKYDSVVPVRNSERLASLIPSANLVVWDRCGHLPHEEHPEDFIKLTKEFVDSL